MTVKSQLDILKLRGITLRSSGFDCPPRTRYRPYARLLDDPTGDGQTIRRGFPRAWWMFDILTGVQMGKLVDALEGEESAVVYITTTTDRRPSSEYGTGQYADFSAVMRIAEKTEATNMEWHNVVVEFTRLQEV